MKNKGILLGSLQIVSAVILLFAGVTKFLATEGNVFIFTELDMEPTGRIIIGLIETAAALMLMTKNYAAMGALFGLGTMCGAVIAHVSILGFNVQGDQGLHIVALSTVVLCTGTVLIARRKTLPLIGPTLD